MSIVSLVHALLKELLHSYRTSCHARVFEPAYRAVDPLYGTSTVPYPYTVYGTVRHRAARLTAGQLGFPSLASFYPSPADRIASPRRKDVNAGPDACCSLSL